ncbi:serine/threonine-protein phosphatase 7 long form homolog [Lycium barbarum]|uniref:serine/threonine-protein phosphatase 7 long form homolog n=1 Tax=Lycium barbarum TaxID=112863 RepID=UPI00293E855B|nr:serine/threonine-protein phosphatase 7 long form homolog [Lycium barbarum]
MTEDQFIWEPYSDELIESLPDYCRVGRNIWRARVTIFCWDVVEVHLPDRVMRQFGMIQEIPPTPFAFDPTHFNHDRRGRPNTNWEFEHAQWLPFWHQRLRYVINAPVNHESLRYDDPYLVWFRRITRLVIGNPTSRPQRQQGYVPNATAYEAMVRYIHSVVDKAKSLGDQPLFEEFYMFRAMVRSEGEEKVVLLVGGNVLLREVKCLSKWMKCIRKMSKQSRKMIQQQQIVILVPLQEATLTNSLRHQL